MRRLTGIVALVLVLGNVGVLDATASPVASPASFTTHTGLARDYLLYRPSGPAAVRRPLVVYLHGCNQTARDAALGTQWNKLAERKGFVVAYPEQSTEANGTRCWNWFEPAHQRRGVGEPGIIASIVSQVKATVPIDSSRVYVAGASAGADMATIMGATYPDVFAAIGPFAGCGYATCSDVTGALAKRAMGPRIRKMPAIIGQGTADVLNNAALGETAVRQWLRTNGLNLKPTSIEHFGKFRPGELGSGDPCVRANQYPCFGGALGWQAYPYTVAHHVGGRGCSIVDAWYIHGLSHNYPTGDPAYGWTDPIGPDFTAAAWRFFTRHRVGSPCSG